jgi:hypothetical protein
MAAIKASKYLAIANHYANAQLQLVGVSDYYYQAAYEILQITDQFPPEIDLLRPLYDTYLSVQTIYSQVPASVVNAVATLNIHVLNNARTQDGTGRYTNINDWLEADNTGTLTGSGNSETGRYQDTNDAAIKVPRKFASISSLSGFTIDESNIE